MNETLCSEVWDLRDCDFGGTLAHGRALDGLLRSLLLGTGLLEGMEVSSPALEACCTSGAAAAGAAAGAEDAAAVSAATAGSAAARAEGAVQPATSSRGLSVSTASTLQDLRHGPLADMAEDAQVALLSGTLYTYGRADAALVRQAPTSAPPLRHSLHLTAPAGLFGPMLSRDAEEATGEVTQQPTFAATFGASMVFGASGAASASAPRELGSLRAALADLLRRAEAEAEEAPSPPASPSYVHAQSLACSSSSSLFGLGAATPLAAVAAAATPLHLAAIAEATQTLRPQEGAGAGGGVEATPPRRVAPGSDGSYLGRTQRHWDVYGDESIGAFEGEATESAGHLTFSSTVYSEDSSILSMHAGSMTLHARTMLRRLAAMDASLIEESLSRSVRRVLEMGIALSGGRLSDEEIEALPKVRFEMDEQQCSVCLERFQPGELLTELPCAHFFHVECIAGWFKRSAQCPLCRAEVS